jgi:prevent-host-death family protein
VTTVGTFEAKTHLTRLLERVARGQRIVITNRGRPVAMLVPPEFAV